MAQGDIVDFMLKTIFQIFGWIFGKLIDLAFFLIKIIFQLLGSLIAAASKGTYSKIKDFLNKDRSKGSK